MGRTNDDISLSKKSTATNLYHILTHFMSLVSFYTPENIRKPFKIQDKHQKCELYPVQSVN